MRTINVSAITPRRDRCSTFIKHQCSPGTAFRAKHKQFLPTVLSFNEVREILSHMSGTTKLMAELIYGTGMRVNECVQMRIKDVDFGMKTITVRQGKGGKDRTTMLPERLHKSLQAHILTVMTLHKDDVLRGAGYAPLPGALYKKYPKAGQSVGWQYVFPSAVTRVWSPTGQTVRWHCSASTAQRAFKAALQHTPITKHSRISSFESYHTVKKRRFYESDFGAVGSSRDSKSGEPFGG